jgi:hypothetical protein
MPQAIDYDKLASQHGGVDYDALAAEVAAQPVPKTQGEGEEPTDRSAAERFVSNAAAQLNPVTIAKGLWAAVSSPVETGKALVGAQADQFRKAGEAYQQGRLSEAAGYAGAGVLPLVGPWAAGIGEQAGAGDIAGAAGALTGGLAGPAVLKAGAKAATAGAKRAGAALATKPAPAVAEAVEFGMRRGVPVDAATATGNPAVRGAQYLADRSLGGAPVGLRAAEQRASAMQRVAGELANEAYPSAMTPEQAGEALRAAVKGVIRQRSDEANAAYGKVRAAEAAAVPDEVPVRQKPGKATPAAAVAPDDLTPERAFLLRWLADDLDEIGFPRGGSTKASRDAAYEAAGAADEAGKRGMVFNPRVAGTPVQQMLTAAGVKGSRATQAARIRKILTGEAKDAKLAAIADAIAEAFDGQRFDFDLVSEPTLLRTGLRRRDFRSPVTMPSMDAPGVGAFFPEEAASAAPKAAEGMQAMQLAVDLRDAKASLAPLLDRLNRKRELTGQLMGDEGRAAVALDALVNGPDHAPLSVVDAALGDIKAMARGAEMPELRTTGQGLAAQAVADLDLLVRLRAEQAGPQVLDALEQGRAATKAKWGAADVLDTVSDEPVRAFRQATARGDAGIDRLREVAKLAPGEMPKVGRAVLEELFGMATAEGGFDRGARLFADWQALGPETKKLLYPNPMLRADLDKFFLLAKKMAENPNPSGSALVGALVPQGYALMTPAGVPLLIGSAALSGLLHSPRGVRLLTRGLETPATGGAGKSLAMQIRALVPSVRAAQVGGLATAQATTAPSGAGSK